MTFGGQGTQPIGVTFVAQNIQRYLQQINQSTQATARLTGQLVRLQQQGRVTNQQLQSQSGVLRQLGRDMQEFTQRIVQAGALAGAAFAGLTVKTAAGFETSFARIDALTNATTEDIALMRSETLKLLESVPVSPDELGATAYFILSSGISDAATAIPVLEKSAKAAAIGLGESEKIANILTSAINVYGRSNITAAQATDILTATVNEGKGEAREFSNDLGRLIPFSAAVGVGFDELGASLAALTNGGLITSEAITGLLGIFNQLQSPSDQARQALASVGTSIDEIRQNIRDKGFIEAMREFVGSFRDIPQVFERAFPEVRGFNAFLSAFVLRGEETAAILGRIRQAAGITDRAFATMSKTFDFQVKLLRNQLNLLMIDLGSEILPLVTNEIKNLIHWFRENRESISSLSQDGFKVLINLIIDTVRGLELIIKTLGWIPSNEARLVAAIAAVGAAMVIAFGPKSAALAGLVLIVSNLERIYKLGQGLGGFIRGIGEGLGILDERQARLSRRAQLEKDIADTEAILRARGIDPNAAVAIGPRPGGPIDIPSDLQFAVESLRSLRLDLEETFRAPEFNLPADTTINVGVPPNPFGTTPLPDTEAGRAAEDAAEKFARLLESALSDGIIELAEAIELEFTPAQAGAAEATHHISQMLLDQATDAYNLEKAIAALNTTLADSEAAFVDFSRTLATRALEAQRAAADSIFAQPTREEATLQFQLATVEDALANVVAANRPAAQVAEARIEQLNNEIQSLGQSVNDTTEQLRDQNDATLRNLRNQRSDEQEALRDRQETELDALRRQRDDQLELLKDVREAELKALRDTREAELESISDIHRAQMSALQERQAAELAALRKSADTEIEALRREADRFTPIGGETAGTLQAQAAITRSALETRIREIESSADEQIAARRVSQQKEEEALRERLSDELEARRKAVDDELDAVRNRTEDEMDALRRRTEDEIAAQRRRAEDELESLQRRAEAEIEAFQERIEREAEAIELATENQIKAKEAEIKAIQDAQAQITEPYRILADQIRDQYEKLQRQNDLQRLSLILADQTLISEDQQNQAVIQVKDNILALSSVVGETSRLLGESLIPDFDNAAAAARTVFDAFNALSGVNIPGRASGGPVTAGQPYWVGEGGMPELFVPNQSGMIVPSTIPMRWGSQRGDIYNDNRMDINGLTLPNVLSGDQLVDQIDRKQSRRVRLAAKGSLL